MKRHLFAALFAASLALPATADEAPRVRLQTNLGDIVLELAPDKAPITVANFLDYVRRGIYERTIFHRVIAGFVLQGGGFTHDFVRQPTEAPIRNEADNGLRNARGTISMARTSDPHSATSQFFISLADNAALDHTGKTVQGWGYAVFGRVVEGMDVVDRIGAVRTGARGSYRDVPVQPVTVESAEIVVPSKPE